MISSRALLMMYRNALMPQALYIQTVTKAFENRVKTPVFNFISQIFLNRRLKSNETLITASY